MPFWTSSGVLELRDYVPRLTDSPTPLCPLQLREAACVVELPHTTVSDGESENGYWQVAQMPPSFMSASAAAAAVLHVHFVARSGNSPTLRSSFFTHYSLCPPSGQCVFWQGRPQ